MENRKNVINVIILFFNFTFGNENFVEIDWFMVKIQQIYNIEILFKIWKHAFCSINVSQMKKIPSTKLFYGHWLQRYKIFGENIYSNLYINLNQCSSVKQSSAKRQYTKFCLYWSTKSKVEDVPYNPPHFYDRLRQFDTQYRFLWWTRTHRVLFTEKVPFFSVLITSITSIF